MRPSSIRADGRRDKVRLADVCGPITHTKNTLFTLWIAILVFLPFLKVNGRPALLLDILNRHFFIFGTALNAQDTPLLFFIASGSLFLLLFATALWGRIWCGFACPQTVFLEGLFRKIERLVDGSRSEQVRLAKAPWSRKKLGKLLLKHALYAFASLLLSHVFLSYFVSYETLWRLMHRPPSAAWPTFSAMGAIAALLYFNFAWFREQLCLIVCPYGRIQSALTDDDTLVVGYDVERGEPRGKKANIHRGDCIDCERCIAVCPTAIDIREGFQLECLGCGNCIDACNAIMKKVGQTPGLIRWDSLNGFLGKKKRLWRPRIAAYTALLFVGMLVFSAALSARTDFEAALLRLPGLPYHLNGDRIQNAYAIHLINKTEAPTLFEIQGVETEGLAIVISQPHILLAPLESRHIPLFIETPQTAFQKDRSFSIVIRNKRTGVEILHTAPFLGPTSKN